MLKWDGFSVTSGRLESKSDAEKLCAACTAAGTVTVKSVEKKNRKEQSPALYDLTTLQREANRMLGFTAQQTLDYVQSLYEKKLCTYPRTDSRYLTADMERNLPEILKCVDKVISFSFDTEMNYKQVICSEKVSDHHAIIPTKNIAGTDLSTLPSGENAVLHLIMTCLLCAVSASSEYAETTVVIECAGQLFHVKGRITINPGWQKCCAVLNGQTLFDQNNSLPEISEGQRCHILSTEIKEGKTTPSAHFSEDSLLGAMETAGAKEMPAEAERKGLGTPATRAAIIEKLIASGLIERKKMKTSVRLLPTEQGTALASVLPEQLCSPLLTAEWEQKLKEIERGRMKPEIFMDEITASIHRLVETTKPSPDAEKLFPDTRESIGKCPRCGRSVIESKKGFVCSNRICSFALWKGNRFFTAKKKALTKEIAATLLKDGRVFLKGCYSQKTGKTYDATVILNDTGGKFVEFQLTFDKAGTVSQ